MLGDSKIFSVIKNAIIDKRVDLDKDIMERVKDVKEKKYLNKLVPETEIPGVLYHATTADPENIKKMGLLTSYQDNLGVSAVYFFKTEINARHIIERIINRYQREVNLKKYMVEVSTKNIQSRFFQDPNSLGLFTTENIPSEAVISITPIEETNAFQQEKLLGDSIYPFTLQGVESEPLTYNLVAPDDSEIYGKIDTANKQVTITNFQWESEDPDMMESYDPEAFKNSLTNLGYSVFID